jgi:diguanylate cyclase (GGDEF)-like protein/PAS domain S-box-containing protein
VVVTQEVAGTSSTERQLAELLQFVYLMPVAIAQFGANGAIEMLNPKAVQVLHDLDINPSVADCPCILDALCPGLADRWRATAGQVGLVLPPQRCTPPGPHGAALHLLLQLVRPDERCTMLAIEDVTSTVEQERELARQRRRIGLVLEQIHGYCVVMLDVHGAVSEWNPSIGRLFDVAEGDLVGRPLMGWMLADLSQRATPVAFPDVQAALARQGWCRMHVQLLRLDQRIIWGDCMITPVVEADGVASGYVAVIRDVTDEHLRTRQLMDEATTDPLTGLCNRRGLEQRVGALLDEPGGAPAVQTWIMVDIDHFKQVNDTHGHDGGDIVLKAVATTLQATARDGDTLARVGGEEFVLLLPGATASIGLIVAERLRLRIAALVVDIGGLTVRLTASFGVAQQGPDEAWAAALSRADVALFSAKNEGRNRAVLAAAAPLAPGLSRDVKAAPWTMGPSEPATPGAT